LEGRDVRTGRDPTLSAGRKIKSGMTVRKGAVERNKGQLKKG